MTSAELQRRLTAPGRIDGSFDQEPPSDRRIHERLRTGDLEWLRGASVKYGAEVRVLNISAGGLLLETPQALKPNSSVVLELTGPDSPILVPSRVLRCRVASLSDILTYEGACAFRRPLTLPELTMKLTAETTPPAMVNVPSSRMVVPTVDPWTETWPELSASLVSESVTFPVTIRVCASALPRPAQSTSAAITKPRDMMVVSL